jgi:hypothetical protein
MRTSLQTCITWVKKFSMFIILKFGIVVDFYVIFPFLLCIVNKGANEWKHVCLDSNLPKRK